MPDEVIELRKPTLMAVAKLKPHPRNYREHPDDQIEHLMASMNEHGVYRNVVVAKDGTILAGHGVIAAATRLGIERMLVVKLDIEPDSPQALKVLAADNYLDHMAVDNDRMLSELLRDVHEHDTLLGTGFDEMSLAGLLMVTRSASEIRDLDEAAEWVGLPDFVPPDARVMMTLHFENEADRERLVEHLGVNPKRERTWSAWWPARDREDRRSLRWDTDDDSEA